MSGALESLERAKGGEFSYRHGGVRHTMPDPASLPYELIIYALERDGHGIPVPRMPEWKRRLLVARWMAHHDIGTLDGARRLGYLIDRYSAAIEYDLRTYANGADLGALWRSRRWRYLLNLIDHLPGWSYFADAVSNDEEHAEMLVKAQQAQGADASAPPVITGPPLHTWTPERAALASVEDAVNRVAHALIVVNSDPKKGKPEPPKPVQRPSTAIEKARKRADFHRRNAKHKQLAARLLPHKYNRDGTPK